MSHYFAIVTISLAAAAAMVVSLPADSASVNWELPGELLPATK